MTDLTDQLEELAVAVYGQEPPYCQWTADPSGTGDACPEVATHLAVFDCGHNTFSCAPHAELLRNQIPDLIGYVCWGSDGASGVHHSILLRVVPI